MHIPEICLTILFVLSVAIGLWYFLDIVSDIILKKKYVFWSGRIWVICSTYNVWYLLIHSNF